MGGSAGGGAAAKTDVPVRQVMIQVRLVESNRSVAKDLGFDWSVGATARLDYALPCAADHLTASLGYEFDFTGISRLRTPTNLEQDGSPRIQTTQEPSHRLAVSVTYAL
jgi:type II secretory pathway component HofQ